MSGPAIQFRRRQHFEFASLQHLFVRAWGDPTGKPGYEKVLQHSFTWITAGSGDELIGFVNVAWDRGVHFFLLDTTVDPDYQRQGIGMRLVREAIDACRGCGEWVHVDAAPELMKRLYFPAGFTPSDAGVANITR